MAIAHRLLGARADVNKSTDSGGLMGVPGTIGVPDMGAVAWGEDTSPVSPLWLASYLGHVEMVSLLLEAGADMDKPNSAEVSPLCAAYFRGNIGVVKLLLGARATVDPVNVGFRDLADSLLFHAAAGGNTEVVSLLLEAGVDKEDGSCDGKPPLWGAAEAGHVDVVRLLLAAGANKDAVDSTFFEEDDAAFEECYQDTPLWIASRQGHADVVSALLQAKADAELPNIDGQSPLWIASKHGHGETVRLLLLACVEVNRSCESQSPLWVASVEGHKEVAFWLLVAGADPECTAQHGDGGFMSALGLAAAEAHTGVQSLLLAASRKLADECQAVEQGMELDVWLLSLAKTVPLEISPQLGDPPWPRRVSDFLHLHSISSRTAQPATPERKKARLQ